MTPERSVYTHSLMADLDGLSVAGGIQVDNSNGKLIEKGFSSDLKIIVGNDIGRYIIRRTNNRDLSEVSSQIDFVKYLSGKGFPVPSVIGDMPFAGLLGTYVVWEFVEGDVSDYPNGLQGEDLTASAKLLGNLHLLADEYGVKKSHPSATHLDVGRQLNVISEVENLISARDEHDDVDISVASALQKKKEKLLYVAANPSANEAVANIPQTMIHGDYHGANLVFEGNNIKALIDWEESMYWSRLAEVQASIVMNCKENITEHFNTSIDLVRARYFLDAYEEVYPISKEEKEIMSEMATLDTLRIDFLLERHYLKGDRIDMLMPKKMSEWFWWEDNIANYNKSVLAL